MAEQGVLLGGRYQLGGVLGRGGMAEVRRARDIRLGRDVAVKQLRIDLAGDDTFQARFRREAQAAAGLNHPNIVSVYDTGEQLDEQSGVNVPYIVMELVVGHTLRDLLRDGRKIRPERALQLTMDVLDALQYSHTAGIIHRDIKPANVMLTSNGTAKVMDFGIARAVADTSASMTQTAAVIGTAQYLSPEQARGEKTVDNRSDIYAAGCMLYELLVGQPPFRGDSPVSVAYQHVREIPVPPSQIDDAITPDMDAIVLTSLAKDPADRYQSAKEMRDDIARLLAGQAPTAQIPVHRDESDTPVQPLRAVAAPITQTGVAEPAPPVGVVEPVDEVEEPEEPRRSKTGIIIGVLVGLLALALAAGYFFVWRAPAPVPTPTPSVTPQVQVPQVITMTQQSATSTLEESKLEAVVKPVEGPDDATVNTVVDQSPVKGTSVAPGSQVTITVNVGPSKVQVPGLVGQPRDAAKAALEAAGFTKVTITDAPQEPITAAAGSVVSTNPAEGAVVAKATPITVYVATGKSAVPNLLGYTGDDAVAKAKQAGFANVKVADRESTQQAGRVVETDPKADQVVDRATTITIYVAKAPTPTPTPTPAPTSATPAPSTPAQSSKR